MRKQPLRIEVDGKWVRLRRVKAKPRPTPDYWTTSVGEKIPSEHVGGFILRSPLVDKLRSLFYADTGPEVMIRNGGSIAPYRIAGFATGALVDPSAKGPLRLSWKAELMQSGPSEHGRAIPASPNVWRFSTVPRGPT